MQAVFHLAEEELNETFLQNLKAQFKSQKLTIVVDAQAVDETEYLLDNPINAERLMRAVENIREGKNLVELDLGNLKAQFDAENHPGSNSPGGLVLLGAN
jgi:antitoxin YefM